MERIFGGSLARSLGRLRKPTVSMVLSLAIAGGVVRAQAPSLGRISPAGGQRGSTVELTLTGSNLGGISSIWTDLPIQVTVPKDQKEAGKVVVQVYILPDATVRTGGIRVVTPKGISNLRLFAIDDLQQLAEREPNSKIEQAQKVELPCVIDGTMEAESWDYYRFSVQAGQRLTMEVMARRLGSKFDPQIRLLDARGRELLTADDSNGLGQDARLTHTFQNAGEYVLEVRDVTFSGGGDHFYRLRMGDFPAVTVPFPMGAKRGSRLKLVSTGPETGRVPPLDVSVPDDPSRSTLPLEVRSPTGGKVAALQLHLDSLDEITEQEPNDQPADSTRFSVPAMLNGRFTRPGDIDRFRFAAKKGARILFQTISRQLGSPVDLFMTVENSSGKELASNDDQGRSDARIDFRIPADGEYTVNVWDLIGRGGNEFVYRIRAVERQADFRLLIRALDKNKSALDRFNVPQGSATALLVRPVRVDYKGPIALSLDGVPSGITLTPKRIRAGAGDTIVTLNAPEGVRLGAAQVRIVGTATIDGKKLVRFGDAGESLASGLGLVWPPANLSQSLALAVTEPPQFTIQTQLECSVLGRGTTLPICVTAKRSCDFDEPLTLAVQGLANVSLDGKSIAKAKGGTTLKLTAKKNAPLGVHSIVITATGKKGKRTITVAAPALQIDLRMPITVSLNTAAGRIMAGEKLKIKARVERILGFEAAVELELKNLPEGVTAPKATIAQGEHEVEIELTAAADAPAATVKNLSLVATVKIEDDNQSVSSPGTALEVIAAK